MSIEAVTVGDAALAARDNRTRKRNRILASVPLVPEPPGPRAVVLAMARLGLVAGSYAAPLILGAPAPVDLRRACQALIDGGALAFDVAGHYYRLTAHGLDLHGPDLRQRPFLSTR